MKAKLKLRDLRWTTCIVLLAMLLPPLLMTPIIWVMAEDRAQAESTITATTIRRQVDSTLDVVFTSVEQASALMDGSCPIAAGPLARLANTNLYYRSLNLVRNNRLYCTSLGGKVDFALPEAFNGVEHFPLGRGITPITGSVLVPNRPAVIASLGTGSNSAAVAVIDGQYLVDIQEAAAGDGKFQVAILHKDTRQALAPTTRASDDADFGTRVIALSDRFPIEVQVSAAQAMVAENRGYLWRHHAPFLLLACCIMGYLAYRFCQRRLSLASDLLRGMRNGEFSMVYQPVLHLPTGEVCGVESLVRWYRPGQGPIRPDIFISLAEDNGLIVELTRHIFALVAADLPQLGLRPQDHLGINISGQHLAMPEFARDVEELLHKLGPDRPRLVLELTERAALPNNEQAQRNIALARDMGVLWALDDFGTGQSALGYLEQLSADFIKVDRSFVSGIGTDSVNAVVLDTIIALGQRLHLQLTAEGIETEEQATYLRNHGVQWGQGYLYAAPLTPSQLAQWRQRRAQG